MLRKLRPVHMLLRLIHTLIMIPKIGERVLPPMHAGRECRRPFNCTGRVDEGGSACKCPRNVGRHDCHRCSVAVTGTTWLVTSHHVVGLSVLAGPFCQRHGHLRWRSAYGDGWPGAAETSVTDPP